VSFSDIYSEGIGSVSIIGMYDPLSMLNYNNGILVEDRQYLRITAQNVSENFEEEDMFDHLSDSTFVFNENAPSYLQRFAGSAESSSCCGIQTVYLPGDLATSDIETSFVDHKFGSVDCTETNPVYYITSARDDLGGYSGGNSPYFELSDIEFYHLNEENMPGISIGLVSCPVTES
jgi:hypothetical protein